MLYLLTLWPWAGLWSSAGSDDDIDEGRSSEGPLADLCGLHVPFQVAEGGANQLWSGGGVPWMLTVVVVVVVVVVALVALGVADDEQRASR